MHRTFVLLLVLADLIFSGIPFMCGLASGIGGWLEPAAPAVTLNPDWLITAPELNRISHGVGIVQWQVTEDIPGQHRICRMYEGVSWSASPNGAMNCANKVQPGNSFEQVIESLYGAGILYPTDIELEPGQPHTHDFALYAHRADNGHTVYDAFLLGNGVLFRATVTVGTPGGETPETIFAKSGPGIETFLTEILTRNLERAS